MFTSRAVCYATNTTDLEVYHDQLLPEQRDNDVLRSHRAALSLITRQQHHSTAKVDFFSYAQLTAFYDPLSAAASKCPTDFPTPTEDLGLSHTTVYTLFDRSSEACRRYDAAILLT